MMAVCLMISLVACASDNSNEVVSPRFSKLNNEDDRKDEDKEQDEDEKKNDKADEDDIENSDDREDEKRVVSGTIEFDLPEGFVDSGNEGMWITETYPTDTSNIVYTSAEDDPVGIDFTSKRYEESVEAQYTAVGYEVDLTVDSFEKIEVDGFEAVKIVSTSVISGIEIHQIQYSIQIGKTTASITFTQNGDEWTKEFEECADSIYVIPVYKK